MIRWLVTGRFAPLHDSKQCCTTKFLFFFYYWYFSHALVVDPFWFTWYVSSFLPAAVQQLEFLENRKKQYLKAALQAKQKNDLEQAKVFLRTAKGFEPMIEAARSGKPVDISKVSTRRNCSDPTPIEEVKDK